MAWFILGSRAWLPVARHRRRRRRCRLGVLAAVLETGTASSAFLGVFVAVIVVMYLVSIYEYLFHTGSNGRPSTPRLDGRHT